MKLSIKVGNVKIGFTENIDSYIEQVPMLSGSLVTTTWRVLRLRMEEKASRYVG
jgi:hypothetical protein